MKNTRWHVPLWTKVLLIAILNLAVLGIVCAIFLRLQLKPEFESFLMAQARERIVSLATLVSSDLQNTDESQWDRILQKYSIEHGVTVLLYRNTGEQLAGIPTALPPEVDVRMPRGGPPPPPGGRPFPPPPGGRPFPPPFDDRGPSSARSPFPGPGPIVGPPFLAVTNTDLRYWVGVRMPFIQRRDGEVLRSVVMLVV